MTEDTVLAISRAIDEITQDPDDIDIDGLLNLAEITLEIADQNVNDNEVTTSTI